MPSSVTRVRVMFSDFSWVAFARILTKALEESGALSPRPLFTTAYSLLMASKSSEYLNSVG